jgi:hypothetical protein
VWDHANHFQWSLSSIHRAAFYIFGVQGNTKTYLEDLFGDLTDKLSTYTNQEVSEWSLYYNVIRSTRPCNKSEKDGELAKEALRLIQLQPLDCSNQAFPRRKVGIFNPKESGVEQLFDFEALLSGKNDGTWKAAGGGASRRSYASLAMLQELEGEDFKGVSMAWTSVLLLRHRLYRRQSDAAYFVSFGCEGWAAIGWRLRKLVYTLDGVDQNYFALVGGSQKDPLQTLVSTRLSPDPTDIDAEAFVGIPFCVRCSAAVTF